MGVYSQDQRLTAQSDARREMVLARKEGSNACSIRGERPLGAMRARDEGGVAQSRTCLFELKRGLRARPPDCPAPDLVFAGFESRSDKGIVSPKGKARDRRWTPQKQGG